MKIFFVDDYTDRSTGKTFDRHCYEVGYFIGRVLRFLLIAGASFCVTKGVMFVMSIFF